MKNVERIERTKNKLLLDQLIGKPLSRNKENHFARTSYRINKFKFVQNRVLYRRDQNTSIFLSICF